MNCRRCLGSLWISAGEDWIKCPECNATGDDNAGHRMADVLDFVAARDLRNRRKHPEVDDDGPPRNAA